MYPDDEDDWIGCIGIAWNRGEEFKGVPEADGGPGPLPPTRAEAEYDDRCER